MATGPSWKPVKTTNQGYGQQVSAAAKAKPRPSQSQAGADVAGRMKPVTPKTPTTRRKSQ